MLDAARSLLRERGFNGTTTKQIANAIETTLEPRGVLVVIEAEHLCMSMRGVRKPGSSTVTSSVTGIFREKDATRAEAMRFLESR